MGSIHSLSDVLDMVRRRIWVILAVTIIGCVVSVYLVQQTPHEYESTEVIQFAQPVIAGDLAKSTADGSQALRLQLIEQRLMSRDGVLEIIKKYGLYSDLAGLKQSQKVALLRESIRINGVAAAGGRTDGSISVLQITARMPSPELAQQIAHELGQRTIALTNEDRILQARETLALFDAREQAVRDEIANLEEATTIYRTENELTLPASLEFRREEIAAINAEILSIDREKIEVEQAMERADQNQRPATAARMRADFQDQIATLEAQTKLLEQKKSELEALVEEGPRVQQQLRVYDLQMQQLLGELEQVSARRSEAEIGFRLEAARQAERLMVIEEAVVPDYPSSRSRKQKAMLGGLISLIAGFFAAFLLELRNPVIRSAAQMERELGIKPTVTMPILNVRAEQKRPVNSA